MKRLLFLSTLGSSVAAAVSPLNADRGRIDADLRLLTGETPLNGGEPLVSRYIHHPGNAAATTWLLSRFLQVGGLTVFEEPFEAEDVELSNVIARLEGADPTLPSVILSAHFDSIASFSEGWDPAVDAAPGADDDASGIAAILECARLAVAQGPFERAIEFIAFNAEEQGKLGSIHHVDHRSRAVEIVFNLDPVGFNPGDILFFAYDANSLDEADAYLAAAEALDLSFQVLGVDEVSIGGDTRSDHWPFWQAGDKALHIGSFPQPPTYHTIEDSYDVVDLDFLVGVTELTCARAIEAAGPAVASAGCDTAVQQTALGFAGCLALVAIARRRRELQPDSGQSDRV